MAASNVNPIHPIVRGMKSTAKRASIATQKAKLNADLLFIAQKIKATKHQFGIDLYDRLAIEADADPLFLIEGDALEQIRGVFVRCYKNNAALQQKKDEMDSSLKDCDERRKAVKSKRKSDKTKRKVTRKRR